MITALLSRLRAGEITRHEYFTQLERIKSQPRNSPLVSTFARSEPQPLYGLPRAPNARGNTHDLPGRHDFTPKRRSNDFSTDSFRGQNGMSPPSRHSPRKLDSPWREDVAGGRYNAPMGSGYVSPRRYDAPMGPSYVSPRRHDAPMGPSYVSPHRNYDAHSRSSYDSPRRNYNAHSRSSYDSPGRNYDAPSGPSYVSPRRSYDTPSGRSYVSPQRNYDAPSAPSYDSARRYYDAPTEPIYDSSRRYYDPRGRDAEPHLGGSTPQCALRTPFRPRRSADASPYTPGRAGSRERASRLNSDRGSRERVGRLNSGRGSERAGQWAGDTPQFRPLSAASGGSTPSGYTTPQSGYATSHSNRGNTRGCSSNALHARAVAAHKSACSPARSGPILNLPPFLERNSRWSTVRESKLELLRSQKEREELSMCTRSGRAASASASPSRHSYFGHRSMSASTLPQRCHEPRLRVSVRGAISHAKKTEDEQLAQCTFFPDVSCSRRSYKRSRSLPRRSRSTPALQPTSSSARVKQDPEFAFTPKVIGPQRAMYSCKEYLKTNVFDRLQWTKAQSSGASNASQPTQSGRTSTSRGSADTLRSFLQRQNEHDAMRVERLLEARSEVYADAYKPEINPRSRYLAEKARTPHSLTRVGYDFRERSDAGEMESQWRFKPEINRRSSRRPSRGVDAMHEDHAKKLDRSASRRAYFDQLEDEESPGRKFSFEPTLTSYGYSTPGRVQAEQSASEYIDKYAKVLDKKRRRSQLALDLAGRAAERECTFKPELCRRSATAVSQDVVDARTLYNSLKGQR